MKNIPRIILLVILLTTLLVAANTGITSTDFLDLEDSSDNSLITINNWYDLAWYWRKPVTINNGGGALNDYQVKLTVNTQELISAGKMESDGDDIRFSQSDGTTGIPYWIESGINTTSTVIWTKVPSIPNGDSTIYLYYSNPGASANSSLSDTFTGGSFQDLFNDVSKLDAADSSTIAVTPGEARLLVADTEVMDVSQTEQGTNYVVHTDNYHAQTFYSNISGYLTRVTVRTRTYGSPPNPMEVQIRNATGGDEPGNTVYATASRDDIGAVMADYDFTFNIAPAVTAGTKYAIVIRTAGGDSSNTYRSRYYNNDAYPGGRRLTSGDAGQSWTGTTHDIYFITYITAAAELNQSQVDVSDYRPVYGDNWSAQSFIAGQSGNLTLAAIKAYATGSPPNDLTIELRDAEQTIIETMGQSQTNYSGDRQAYGNNWWAQTFRTESSGDMSKITLRASETGSPPNDLTVELRNVVTGSQKNEDQSQTSYTGDRQVYGGNWEAQIFRAGLSDNLTKVTLRAAETGSPPNDLTVELRNATSAAEENLDVSQVVNDSADNVYSNIWRAQTFQAGYSGELTRATLRLIRNDNDDQSQKNYSGDRQVYGDNWRAQIFEAGITGNLGQVLLRASKTGSPASDLLVELRNAVVGYQDTEDQSQTLYTGDRQVYGDNWRAQIFYPTMSGNLSKVTLRAAKTGTPPNALTVELRDISGGETQDQNQIENDGARGIYGARTAGETFTAGLTGTLTKVTLRLKTDGLPPDPIVVEIRDCTGGDLPGTTVYASANKSTGEISSAWTDYDFIFDSPASVTTSTKYAIAVKTSNGDADNEYRVRHMKSDVYAGGRRVQSNDGSAWTGAAQDTYFVTYVNVGALPGSTVHATASRSDISTVGEYEFTYSTPYEVSSGNQYALVIYTSAGDASHHYTVSYKDSDAYTSGRECYSINGGSSFTGSDSTDLYFRTYVTEDIGALPGSTVYATASQSSITTAGEYAFTYSSPYSITAGAKYALVIYTSAGDASNYYNIAYQDSDAYAGGRECSSANGGSSFTGSDSSDLYFITISGIPLGDITVEIRNCTAGDLPGTTVYASTSEDPFDIATSLNNYDFVFSSPASVTAGVKYAIVASGAAGDSSNRYRWRHQTTDVYADGRLCTSSDSGNSWAGKAEDFYLETYITASAYTPGSTVHLTASRSDITTAGEYDFTYSPSYAVTSGTKYALVIHTSAGDASNYYNISYEDSDNYTSGRECYSTNTGANWTGNDSSDLYFRTYITVVVGDTPGGTVHASASRDDITTAGDYDFVFGSPYSVTAETNYAIVIYTGSGNVSNYYNIAYQNSNDYALGKECASTTGGGSWTPNASADLYFKTYISTVTDDYEPGDTVYATANRSQIGISAAEYTFSFTTPYIISSSTRYTLVVKTTGGDASNYYSVAYQGIDTYSNGNESISHDSSSTWTAGDSDLWFKTYVEYDRSVSASGILRSVTIPTDSDTRFAAGVQISWSDTRPGSSGINYQLEYYTGSAWSLVPDGVLTGNTAGFDTSPVNISKVLTDYDRVRLRANLSSTYSTDIPGVQDWTVTYYYREYAAPEPAVSEISAEE